MPQPTTPTTVTLSLQLDAAVYAGLDTMLDRAEYQDSYQDPAHPEKGFQAKRRFATPEDFIAEALRQVLAQCAALVPALAAKQALVTQAQQQLSDLAKPVIVRTK